MISQEIRDDVNALRVADGGVAAARALTLLAEKYASREDQIPLTRELLRTREPSKLPDVPVRTVASFYYRGGDGGCERVLIDLSSLFVSLGLRAIIITEQPIGEGSYDIPEGVICRTVPPISQEDPEGSALRHFEALRELFDEYEIDAFVNHAWLSPSIVFDIELCRACGVRFVLNTHGVFSFSEAVGDVYFALLPYVSALCDAVVSETETNAFFYKAFNPNSFYIANPLSDEVVASACRAEVSCSAWAGETVVQDGVRMVDRPSMPLSRPLWKNGSHPRILWIGRFDKYKHPEDALGIFAQVLETHSDAELVVVGRSDGGEYEKVLAALARELGIADSVSFEGYTTDVMHYYHETDALLMTTEMEGFSMVLLEASAAALPVVMYELPYLPFAESEGVVGVGFGDIEAACGQLSAILSDEGRRLCMRKGAHEFFTLFRNFDYRKAWTEAFAAHVDGMAWFCDGSASSRMWDTLFNHCHMGWARQQDRRTADLERQRATLQHDFGSRLADAQTAVRQEYEESKSYRLGRAMTSLFRKIHRR